MGLRHSWLSREIIAFGLFAATASAYAALVWWNLLPVASLRLAGQAVVATGTLGLFCSAMIYVFTKLRVLELQSDGHKVRSDSR
ncbi:MAG: hypothetical protein R3C49_27330 [Planctomycetaceae bacterium]